MKNNATRTIRSEEITIDVRICAALAANRGDEVYLATIAPDMESLRWMRLPASCLALRRMMLA